MKSLYDENGKYTEDAMKLDRETNEAIDDLFNKYVADGYSPREISHVMMATVSEIELTLLL